MAKKDHTNEEHKIFVKNEESAPDKQAEQPGTVEPNDQATGEGDQAATDSTTKEAVNEIALAKQVRTLEEENSFLKDQLLRKQAEFENFRKRLIKEKEDSAKYANQMLLLDLTAIIDDFERAIKSADDSTDFTNFHNGIVLIEKQMVSMLERQWGIKRFEPKNEVFDPERHLAISVEESNDQNFTSVAEVFQKGYLFYDRVLRPAKVKVVKPSSQAAGGNTAEQTAQEENK
jgi:molecular chaperone GrpE